MVWRPRKRRRVLPKWNPVEVTVGEDMHRGRFRLEGDEVVLEWREGRVSEPCGLVRADVLARYRLRLLAAGVPFPGKSKTLQGGGARRRPIA
ncbi:MAG TPA: hypothetical protein VIE16_04340 [Phenylobacterium sp.]|jgi:hypothetical protein